MRGCREVYSHLFLGPSDKGFRASRIVKLKEQTISNMVLFVLHFFAKVRTRTRIKTMERTAQANFVCGVRLQHTSEDACMLSHFIEHEQTPEKKRQ